MPKNTSRIYVVEDEVIVARDIRQQLVGLGYADAGHATSAERCLEQLAVAKPDLVLMDIQLAGAMDGIAAAQIIRTEFDIPVVFLTAFAADDVLARAKLTEPYGYILKPFSERELRTVLEMAIYKSNAERTMRHNSKELKLMSQRVIEVQESERRRLALELHDELGQSLTAIKINLATRRLMDATALESFDKNTIGIIDDAILKVRSLALSLRPGLLDDLGLQAALEWMVEQRASAGATHFRLESNLQQQRLPTDIETTFFRVAQESLTNIQRHAQANSVQINLFLHGDTLTLSVVDDGCGMDWETISAKMLEGKSLGLAGMRDRANLIGATVNFDAPPHGGSEVRLTCTLPALNTGT
jgi:signal transduction histidine kinase